MNLATEKNLLPATLPMSPEDFLAQVSKIYGEKQLTLHLRVSRKTLWQWKTMEIPSFLRRMVDFVRLLRPRHSDLSNAVVALVASEAGGIYVTEGQYRVLRDIADQKGVKIEVGN